MLHCLVLQEEVDEGGGGQRGQNFLLPVPYSPITRTFISRLPPYLVLLPSPINLETQNTSLKESKFVFFCVKANGLAAKLTPERDLSMTVLG